MEKIILASNLYLVPVGDKYQVYLNNELIFNGCLVDYIDGTTVMVVHTNKYVLLINNYNDINFGIFMCAKHYYSDDVEAEDFAYYDIYMNRYTYCISIDNIYYGYRHNKVSAFYYDNRLIIKNIFFDFNVSDINEARFGVAICVNRDVYCYIPKYNFLYKHNKKTTILGRYIEKYEDKVILDKDGKICVKYDVPFGEDNGYVYYARDQKYYIFYDGIEYMITKDMIVKQDYCLYNDWLINNKIFLNLRKKKMLYAINKI